MEKPLKFKPGTRPEAEEMALTLAHDYEITDSGGQCLVVAFADAYTTELNALDEISKTGMVILDRYERPKSHPLLPTLRDARAQQLAALKALHLDIEPLRDGRGRPPGK